MRAMVVRALRYLGNAHPALRPTAEMIGVWESLLRDFSDEEVWRAAEGAARREHYGPPTVASLIAEIRGVERVVHVRARDLWDRYILRDDGGYQTEVRRIRWFPDGREEPLALPSHEENLTITGHGMGHIGGELAGLLGDEEC